MTSRWATWTRGVYEDQKGFSSFLSEQQTPAEMARSMGLQSDGSGGYTDESGNVVARTVNNELVFYDPMGGAISAQSDGAQLTQAQPSWRDPVTGEIVVPPGQPESPEEIKAIPDPVPALAPAGYSAFMNKKKKDMYAAQGSVEQDILDTTQQEIDPRLGFPDPTGMREENEAEVPTFKGMVSKMKTQKPVDTAPKVAVAKNIKDGNIAATPKAKKEVQMFDPEQRKKDLHSALDRMVTPSTLPRGAGANDLSNDDIKVLQNYIKNGSVAKRTPLNPGELDEAIGYLKGSHKEHWNKLQNRMKAKGDTPKEMKNVARARRILESYLEYMGKSAVTGQDVPFSESELDHIMSLDNGGVDDGENWAWMEKRFNQVKNKLDDDALLAKLQRMAEADPADARIQQAEKALKNRFRGDWKEYFGNEGWDKITQGDIRGATGATGMQFLKGLAEASGTPYYKDRGVTRDSGRAGGGTSLGVEELQDRLIEALGIPSQDQLDMFDDSIVEVLQNLENARADLKDEKMARTREKRAEKKAARALTLEEFFARIKA